MNKNDILLQDYNPNKVDICGRCEERLERLYPQGIPAEALRRYRKELLWMKQYHCEETFQFMSVLHELAESHGSVISLRGGIGGSFLLYLLCEGRCNPLPAHYYCPKCGHYEAPDEYRYAPDMPQKNCPVCGAALRADGFSIPAYAAFGVDGSEMVSRWNVNVSEAFMPYAKALMETYHSHHFLLCECEQCNRLENAKQGSLHGEVDWLTGEWAKIGWEKIAEIESNETFAEALAVVKPQNFRQMMAVLGCISGTYKNKTKLLPDMPKEYAALSLQEQLEQYPAFHREDIYEHLLNHDFTKEDAGWMATIIGKGQHNLKMYQDMPRIPDCLKEITANIGYLFPRAHNVERLWLDAHIVLLEGR